MQEKLSVTAQAWVDFAVLVEVRRVVPTAISAVQVEQGAFSNIEEKANIDATSVSFLKI